MKYSVLIVNKTFGSLNAASKVLQNYVWLFKKVQGLEATAALLQGLTPAQLMKIVLAPLEIECAWAFKDEQVRNACAHVHIS